MKLTRAQKSVMLQIGRLTKDYGVAFATSISLGLWNGGAQAVLPVILSLENLGLISMEPQSRVLITTGPKYSLTEHGRRYLCELAMPSNAREAI